MKNILFIWQLSSMPTPTELVSICKQFDVRAVAIKILNSAIKWNVPSQTNDRPLLAYIDTLRTGGVEVQGWGYHYPEQSALQGDAIVERMEKLRLSTYHINLEVEWEKLFGMPKAVKSLLDKLKFAHKYSICSFRFPKLHNHFPWDAAMSHPAVDLATPQVYWIGAHNPVEQLDRTETEYARWGKQLAPVGPLFGQALSSKAWWEPSVNDITSFRKACEGRYSEILWWSFDWVISHKRFDWLEVATGRNTPQPPPPPQSNTFQVRVTAAPHINLRSDPSSTSLDLGNVLRGSTLTVEDVPGLDFYMLPPAFIFKRGTEKV